MKKQFCVAPLAFLLCLASIFGEEWSAEQRDVLASLNKYFSAIRQGNQKEIVDFWHPKFVGWDYAQALPANYDAHLKVIGAIGKSFRFKKLEFNPLEIQVESNIAIIHGKYDAIIQDSAGKETPTSGPETITLVKTDGKWAMIGLVSIAK